MRTHAYTNKVWGGRGYLRENKETQGHAHTESLVFKGELTLRAVSPILSPTGAADQSGRVTEQMIAPHLHTLLTQCFMDPDVFGETSLSSTAKY